MVKHFTFILFLLASVQLFSQDIREIKAYNKLGGTRIVAFLSNDNVKWYTEEDGWKDLEVGKLPDGKIKILEIYHKASGLKMETRLTAIQEDNSIWWKNDDKWVQVTSKGLPSGYSVKHYSPYAKAGMGGTETRLLITLEDNTIWWYAADSEKWEETPLKGLPDNANIEAIQTYQKYSTFGGGDTRIIVKLADNTIWWYAQGKGWEEFKSKGLPEGKDIEDFAAYMKYQSFGMTSGRLIAALEDNSLWWIATDSKNWEQLKVEGLPSGYQIRSFQVYQKYNGLSADTRVVLLLEDNTIWWFDEKKGWNEVPTDGVLK